MDLATTDDAAGNVIKEAYSSKQSSVSELEKDIGNAHVIQKSSSFESEDNCKMVSQSVSQSQYLQQQDSTAALDESPYNSQLSTNGQNVPQTDGPQDIENIEPTANKMGTTSTTSESHTEFKMFKVDRQTSTTSLEERHRESKAEALLALLGRGDIGTRPHSMPANLTHLWQSLKISSELNKAFEKSDSGQENSDTEEASGHKVNKDDGLHSKPIDLDKLFTPASDSGEITPKSRRKMFASSSFYSPNHPTVEEQVELARRISNSLSDISNRESKGQSMYVNRKKRSVKWIHEGEGKLQDKVGEFENFRRKNEPKPPLKLVMDPRGQVQDITTLQKQGYSVDSPMSPEVCFDLVRDLNAPRGKGAELFAKRRKKSEKWIIDESNVKTSESYQTQQTTSYNKLPPTSYLRENSLRMENTQKMNQIQERFTLPRLKLIKSPWEAALEGSVESAFQEVNSPRGVVMAPTPTTLRKLATPTPPPPAQTPDVYKGKTPRAWNPQPTCKSFNDSEPFPTVEKYPQHQPSTPSTPVDLTGLNNFNTAPRGWQKSMSYYRPVTFNTKQGTFTDF